MKTPVTTILRQGGVYLLSFMLLFHTYSCTYFKTKKISSDFEASIKDIGELHKYFILHDGINLFKINDLSVDSVNISGELMVINEPFYYTQNRSARVKKEEKGITNEVHIYLRTPAETLTIGYADIPLEEIKELRIIDIDTGKTVASYIFGNLGVAAGVLVIISIIAFLTKSSCPYVYVNNGEAFIFSGETYGGAIGANLTRDDYLPLPGLKVVDDTYQLRITNELKERQYTDLAELIVVNHLPEHRTLLDKSGKVHVIGNQEAPLRAKSYSGSNLLQVIAEKDTDSYLFNDENFSENGLILNFKKPAAALTGKLLLSGKNTLWFDYVVGEFFGKFGGSFDSFMDRQSKIAAADRLKTIQDNNFPLSVYAKHQGTWKLIDYLPTVGPLASRDFVIPIDLQEYPGEEIEIKIETGFMFWELDQVALDFTDDIDLKTYHLSPFTATGSGGENWQAALLETDGESMSQERVGAVADLRFSVPPAADNQVQSTFLHTRGYYELIRDFSGLPKLVELNKFKDPSYFSLFSRAGYLKVLAREREIEKVEVVSN